MLTETQVENVAVLGTVWGFLKYHHPRVAAGELQGDLELFRVLPDISDAADAEARNRRLVQWVDELGVSESCDPCAKPPENAQLLPSLDWIDDVEQLGTALARRLRDIQTRRFSGVEQHYVSQVPRVRNPVFDNELDYPSQRPPDAGYRILSLLRLWNIIEYWFPYRDLRDEDWQAVLREFLPRLVAALRHILGSQADAETVRSMTGRPTSLVLATETTGLHRGGERRPPQLPVAECPRSRRLL